MTSTELAAILPFEGLVVLDFTRHLAGPFATMILRDLGARVIKVEPPGGDPSRRTGPFQAGDSAYFHPINRGKGSVVVDLRDSPQRDRVRALLREVDCLVESFRPGVMERFGLGPEDVRRINPRLVYASCSGFGDEGPYASRPAFDIVSQAMGGVMSVTGHAEGPPTRVGVSQGDIVGGIYAALAVSSALHRRAVTGVGAYLDVSLFEAQLTLATHALGIRAATGRDPERIGNRHPAAAPFDLYPTNDGYVAIGAVEDAQFRSLCDALELPSLVEDERFATRETRLENVDALTGRVARATGGRATDEVVGRLLAASVPCGPVLTMSDLLADPHVEVRGALVEITPWGSDGLPVPALPFRIDGRRPATAERASDLGVTSLDALERELG